MVEERSRVHEHWRGLMADIRHKIAEVRRKLGTSGGRIVLCLLGGTLVWGLYLMIVYPLTSLTCHWGWFDVTTTGAPGLKTVQLLVTAVALVLVAVCGYVAFVEWRRSQAAAGAEGRQIKAESNTLLGYVALLLNGLYALIIAVSLIPIFTLPVCA